MKLLTIVCTAVAMLLVSCQLGPVVPERAYRIAFMTDRDGDFEIYIMDRDGSNPSNLTGESAADGLPTWSPQSNSFAFVTSRDTDNLSIYRMNVDGSNLQRLSDSLPVVPIPIVWASTGDWLAFGSGTDADVYVLDKTGENLVNLTDNPAQDNFETWSPNGQQILFTSDRDGVLAIYIIGIEGGEATRLTDAETNNAGPDWSPDGANIAFMSNRDGDVEVYVMDRDGGNVVRLTDSEEFDGYPAWSPDGTKIAFLSRRDGDAEIYVMNANGSNVQNITNSPTSQESIQGDFAWSPDGKQILFHTDRDGDVEIYVTDADGSNATNLTNNPATDFNSIWVR